MSEISKEIKITPLTLKAIEFLNTPYIWGGNHPLKNGGLDCSGFAQIPLRFVGVIDDEKDRTSQDIYDKILTHGTVSSPDCDCVVFFGKSIHKITHVAIAVSDLYMIEAGGGDETTKTIYNASERKAARVRLSRIDNRSDLVAIVKLKY